MTKAPAGQEMPQEAAKQEAPALKGKFSPEGLSLGEMERKGFEAGHEALTGKKLELDKQVEDASSGFKEATASWWQKTKAVFSRAKSWVTNEEEIKKLDAHLASLKSGYQQQAEAAVAAEPAADNLIDLQSERAKRENLPASDEELMGEAARMAATLDPKMRVEFSAADLEVKDGEEPKSVRTVKFVHADHPDVSWMVPIEGRSLKDFSGQLNEKARSLYDMKMRRAEPESAEQTPRDGAGEAPDDETEDAGASERRNLAQKQSELSAEYDRLAQVVAEEGAGESKAWKKALKTGKEPEMTEAGKSLNAVYAELNLVKAGLAKLGREDKRPDRAAKSAASAETPASAEYRRQAAIIQQEIDTLSDEREGWTVETLEAIADAKARRDAALARATEIEQGRAAAAEAPAETEPVVEATPSEETAAPAVEPPAMEAPAPAPKESLALVRIAKPAETPAAPPPQEPARPPKAEKPPKPKKEKAPTKNENRYDAQSTESLKEYLAWRKERLVKPGRFSDKTPAAKRELDAEKRMIAEMEDSLARRGAAETKADPAKPEAPQEAAVEAPVAEEAPTVEIPAPDETPSAEAPAAPEEADLSSMEHYDPHFGEVAAAFLKDPKIDPTALKTVRRKAKGINALDMAKLLVGTGGFEKDAAPAIAQEFMQNPVLFAAARDKFVSEVEARLKK